MDKSGKGVKTDMDVVGGNSGRGVFNSKGELIGVLTTSYEAGRIFFYEASGCARWSKENHDGVWVTGAGFIPVGVNFVSLQRVRQKYRCSSALVYNVFYEQLEIKLREKKNKRWPDVVCVDEHFFSRSKGFTEYVTMFADLKKRNLYEVALGKDKRSLWDQLSHIPGRMDVKYVVMDMSSTYKSFVREFFPRAQIVADKFHVLRLMSPSIIKHRREIHGHRKDLWVRRRLLMNRKKLDYFVRSEIDFYLKQHGSLNELYRVKEKLHELYRTKGIKRAQRGYELLLKQIENSSLEEVQRLKKTLIGWKNEILNYFKTGFTNGLVEAFNNTGKLVQKQAYGYKSFKNYRLRLLSACF